MPCRGGAAPAEDNSTIERKISTGGGSTTPIEPLKTPTFDSVTALSSPLLIDTIVTTSLIGITTVSVTTSASSSPPTLTTPLLGEPFRTAREQYTEQPSASALTKALSSLPTTFAQVSSSSTTSTSSSCSTSSTCTSSSSSSSANNSTSISQSSGNLSSSQSQQQQQSPSLSSNASSSRLCQSHILTLPLIDEDDEDEVPLRNKVQNDNLINFNADITKSNNNNNSTNSTNNNNINNNPCSVKILSSTNNELSTTAQQPTLTQSPKIKVSLVKTNQPSSPATFAFPTSPLVSSDSDSSVVASVAQQATGGEAISPNKMQAESGSIAELQKYHNKYLKNRRHTLANTAAITLR